MVAYRAARANNRNRLLHMKQQKLDLNGIAVFNKVAGAGSFSAAARELGMPRATVSRIVARLEAALGAQLFYRNTRRVELTELGRAYHEAAAEGLGLIGAAGEAVMAARAEPSGLLRVSAPINFGTMSLIPWISEFLDAHKQVRISLRLVDDKIDPLAERLDLAILTGPQPDSSYRSRRLAASSLILVASPAYVARRGAPERLDSLVAHDFVLFSSDLGKEAWSLDGPEGRVEITVSGRVNVKGPHAELSAALCGLGIALLPAVVTAPYIETGELVQVLPGYGRQSGTITAVFPANRHQPAALRALLDFLVARMAEREPARPFLAGQLQTSRSESCCWPGRASRGETSKICFRDEHGDG
ncbi:LysR family transcriptional regulator [Rhizobium azibense]|uniref:HTH-type transcriptional regulator TtuA n=2 Tax=Rhizobium/Agrobacterium group TaxID=227290 RepID=A0A4R3RYF5_9HYPH|nr:LysR family transcriptional regulator [Rhizobium azibense]